MSHIHYVLPAGSVVYLSNDKEGKTGIGITAIFNANNSIKIGTVLAHHVEIYRYELGIYTTRDFHFHDDHLVFRFWPPTANPPAMWVVRLPDNDMAPYIIMNFQNTHIREP